MSHPHPHRNTRAWAVLKPLRLTKQKGGDDDPEGRAGREVRRGVPMTAQGSENGHRCSVSVTGVWHNDSTGGFMLWCSTCDSEIEFQSEDRYGDTAANFDTLAELVEAHRAEVERTDGK